MKKKLEAELISIAHRILKLKNRSELDQLQQETLRLYEKLSVLRFVEDNFNEVKPTIGYASAEAKLEEVYGIKEEPAESAETGKDNDKTDDIKEEKKPEASDNKDDNSEKTDEVKQDKDNEHGEGAPTKEEEKAPVSEEEKEYTEDETDEQVKELDKEEEQEPEQQEQPEDKKEEEAQGNSDDKSGTEPEGDANPNQKVEEYQASEEEKEVTEEKKDKEEDDTPAQQPEVEEEPEQQEQPKVEEPPKQEARPQFNFDFGSREDTAKKPQEITFENYPKDYKEPEFVKKSDVKEPVNVQKEWLPKEPEILQKQEEKTQSMWGNAPAQPAQQSYTQQQPAQSFAPPSGESTGKTIALGLNDRIAFEKNLFNGSGEDLNRVLSQLNTFERFDDARNFIEDLVKPDYNNWKGKEEYEERLMVLVEQKFK